MAFVYEEVPEKDWDLFNSWKLKNTQGDLMVLKEGISPKGCRYYAKRDWFVDRGREIYYNLLGGEDMGQIDVYALIWKGEKIIIQLRRWVDYVTSIQEDVLHSDILNIKASSNLKTTTTANEIRDIVMETVKAYIFRYWPPCTRFVFDNVATPFFGEVND